jgi:hypothetical protein
MSGRRRHDVFISYSREDKATADAVCAAIESAGIPCWIGPRDTQAGAYGRSIMEAIRAARMLVLILSPHADRTPNVLTEVAEAFDRKLPLVPFRLANFAASDELRFYIRTQHWIDAFPGPAMQYIPTLVKQVKLRLRSSNSVPTAEAPPEMQAAPPDPHPSPSPAPRRRRRVVWSLSATVGALGIGITMSVTMLGSPGPDPGRKEETPATQLDAPAQKDRGPCEFAPATAEIPHPDCFFLDRVTRMALETASDGSAPSTWSNPRSGQSGTIKVLRTTKYQLNDACRNFEMTVRDPKWEVRAAGRACSAAGKWFMRDWDTVKIVQH